jgi:hypothetical protein
MAIPAVRSRRGRRRRKPGKPHADKAHGSRELRDWMRDRGIGVRIARKDIKASEKSGHDRWGVELGIAWTFDYRHLATRYERLGNNSCAFLTPAAALTFFQENLHMRHLPVQTSNERDLTYDR